MVFDVCDRTWRGRHQPSVDPDVFGVSQVRRRPTTLTDRSLLAASVGLFAFAMTCSILGAPRWLENFLRAGVLGLSVGIGTISLVIIRVYARNFKAAPEKARLLPRHVVQLGVMVVLLIFVTSAATITKVGNGLAWFGIPFLLPAVFIGFAGLMDMVRWLPDRRHSPDPMGED